MIKKNYKAIYPNHVLQRVACEEPHSQSNWKKGKWDGAYLCTVAKINSRAGYKVKRTHEN